MLAQRRKYLRDSDLRSRHPRLRSRLPAVLGFAAIASTALLGCVKTYKPPAANEPHAVVKIRRVFHTSPGAMRSTNILLNHERVFERDETSSFDAPQTDAIRVRPGPGSWQIDAVFHHSETRQVQEHYYEQIPHMESESYSEQQSYSCGTGTCYRSVPRTRMVTKYRQEPRTRWVTKTENIVDDKCARAFRQTAVDGAIYVLQFTYTGEGICNLVCLQQTPGASDAELHPCSEPASTPAN